MQFIVPVYYFLLIQQPRLLSGLTLEKSLSFDSSLSDSLFFSHGN